MDVYTLILESLDEGGGSYGRFRRVWARRRQNCCLAPSVLKVMKFLYLGFGTYELPPVTS